MFGDLSSYSSSRFPVMSMQVLGSDKASGQKNFLPWESPNMFQHNAERPMMKYDGCCLG